MALPKGAGYRDSLFIKTVKHSLYKRAQTNALSLTQTFVTLNLFQDLTSG